MSSAFPYEAIVGYDHSKQPRKVAYRFMSLDEAKALHAGQRVPFRDRHGMIRAVTINGKPRTWKRNPNRVEVPYKYGMYEYGRFTARETQQWGWILSTDVAELVVLEEELSL